MKRLKMLIALLVVSVVMVACGGNNASESEDTWTDLEEKGTIIMGLDDTFVPMGFRDNNGEMTGFDVELAREATSRMGLDIEFQAIDWNLKEQELDSGNIDMIWNGYSINDERKEKVNFTKAYLDNKQIIVALKDMDIETKDELEGRTVATQNASSSLTAIENAGALETFKDGEAILFDTYNEAFMDLEAGRVEAVVADAVLARYYMAERGEEKYKVLDGDFGDEEYGVGIRKGDETLLEKLNDALDEMKEDGFAAEISEKWFGENIIK